MDEKYTNLYVVCETFDYEGITSLTRAFHNEEDAIEEMNKLNYGKQSDLFVCESVEIAEDKQSTLDNVPITAEALDQAGWFKEMRGHNGQMAAWMSRPEDGSDDKVVEVWEWPTPSEYLIGCWDTKEEGAIFDHVKTMGQLNDLVLMYTGKPVQKGINNAVE